MFRDYVERVRPSIKEQSVHKLHQRLADMSGQPVDHIFIVDIRETYEWNEEHIPGAYYLGRGCLERDIEHLVPETNDEIILYCAGGVRSVLAAESLQRMGYSNVSSLQGGLAAWLSAGFPPQINHEIYSARKDYAEQKAWPIVKE